MTTMNVSLPSALKEYVDEQAAAKGFASSSEYIRDLIRRDQTRTELRELLLTGARSPQGAVVDKKYFEDLRRALHSDRSE